MSSTSYRTFSDVAAENYERYFVPTIATAVSGPLLAIADLQPGERVLDVACGTGVVARRAASRVGSKGAVTGIDLSPDMIAVARTTDAPVEPTIDWHVGDATSLPVADAAFDAVLCQMGLMFIEDHLAAVREMRRATRPGGRVVISTPGRIQPLFERMEEALTEQIAPELGVFVSAVFSMHEPDTIASLLRRSGLHDVSAVEKTVTIQLPPPADFLWQYVHLTPMTSLVARSTAAQQAAAERQFVDAAQPFVADAAMRLDQPMVFATGIA